jgi:DNA-binding IclR family transcriptional regulator
MGHVGSDDLFTAVVRYFPLLFVVGGLVLLAWLARQRSAQDLQPDVLAALSDTEALPLWTIRRRPPLDTQDVDPDTLLRILEELRGAGLAVRWYEVVPGGAAERQPVYRRVRRVAAETVG